MPCGVNAGGKILTLKALEEDSRNSWLILAIFKNDFETLAEVAGIEEISATYSFSHTNLKKSYEIDAVDEEKATIGFGYPGWAIHDSVPEQGGFGDIYHHSTNKIETRFVKDDGYFRRFGLDFNCDFDIIDLSDEDDPLRETIGVSEQIWLAWEEVFDDRKSVDEMFWYGMDGFTDTIKERIGIEVWRLGIENHDYTNELSDSNS